MPEHFVGFPPAGGTRNYAHGGKGPFTSKFVLAKFQVCCTHHHPPGTPLHKKAGVRAGNFENEPYKIIKRYLSLLCLVVATIDDNPQKLSIQQQKIEKSQK